MVVPRGHKTKGAQLRRRSHLRLKNIPLVFCEHCGHEKLPHRVCKVCGYYKDKEVVNVLSKELKKKEKQRKS
ncbi:MAG: 50S ribosomal protein L32 [Parcubacteria group bacterium]|nr:50S ribosomal protein L32 [Parcubacteria group bacterium]